MAHRAERGAREQLDRLSAENGKLRQTIRDMRAQMEAFRLNVAELCADPILMVGEDGNAIGANRKFEEFFGWRHEELAGLSGTGRSETGFSSLQEQIARCCKSVRVGFAVNGFEARWAKRDGTIVHLSVSVLPLFPFGEEERKFAAIFRDITQIKEEEALLHRTDKLKIIGQLAAGIAHEIRNPLTAIKGFLRFIAKDGGKPKPEYLAIMEAEVERMEGIVNEMLVLSKPQPARLRKNDVLQILREVIAFLSPQGLLHSVEFKDELPDSLPPVQCEESELKQVFINILKNGIESMPFGGSIAIRAETEEGEWIVIRIRDQGVGIPPEILAKMGEPFYTTKEKGTGLGLMVSNKIMEDHRGRLVFESESGKGTTVSVYLPIV